MNGRDIIPRIEAVYNSFTPLEKTIADYFIHTTDRSDLSSKQVAARLFVSEASLSRFAKKCGFHGYREFLFYYDQGPEPRPVVENGRSAQVLAMYQELLNKSCSLLDEGQMERLTRLFTEKKRVYVYGVGSSGVAAEEMKFRFMRIGVNIEAVTDLHLMKMNFVLLDQDCLVMGISISGRPEITDGLRAAKQQGAATVLITTCKEESCNEFCDEVLLCAVQKNLSNGKAISPQFPVLIMVDVLFAHILSSDKFRREALHDSTLKALDNNTRPLPGDPSVGPGRAGQKRELLAGARYGQGPRRRVHLSGPQGRDLLHRQERVDAGPLRLDLRQAVRHLRREGRVACRQQELSGLHGEVLHQPGGR